MLTSVKSSKSSNGVTDTFPFNIYITFLWGGGGDLCVCVCMCLFVHVSMLIVVERASDKRRKGSLERLYSSGVCGNSKSNKAIHISSMLPHSEIMYLLDIINHTNDE